MRKYMACGDGVTGQIRRLRTAIYAFGVSSKQSCTNSIRKEADLI